MNPKGTQRWSYLAAGVLMTLPIFAQTKETLSPEVIYAQSKDSVVTILTFDSNKAPLGQGSGFVIAKNRVVTNYHVLAGSTTATIIFSDGTVAVAQSVIAASHPEDIAIIAADTANVQPLLVGNELDLKVGEAVYAIGAPKGLTASLSNGLVSAFRQEEGQFFIQITAAIAPGSSGGPLFDSGGLVVGMTTSRLKDGGFAFAVGAGDIEHLLKVPLSIALAISDLPSDEATTSDDELKPVQALFDQKEYSEALSSFRKVSDEVKSGFDGQLLLCRIQEKIPDDELAIRACDAAIAKRPDSPEPYALKVVALLDAGEFDLAELAAAKATKLSDDSSYTNLLGLVYYEEEKYTLVPKQFSSDSKNSFDLYLLAGAAFHNGDFDSFQRLCAKITQIKGDNNGWQLYRDGVRAELNLDFDTARENYRKCDDDSDFIDSICVGSLANVEVRQGSYEAAKSQIDSALLRYSRDHSILSEAVFIDLLLGNTAEAKKVHDLLSSLAHNARNDTDDCLYYYGMNQPSLATDHCANSINANEKIYTAWSNAGYVALDNGQFQKALGYFAKAREVFDSSTVKHTVTEELDLTWGLILAGYYGGDMKDSKTLYRAVKKEYPAFSTMSSLKQLPLVWSIRTQAMINAVCSDFK